MCFSSSVKTGCRTSKAFAPPPPPPPGWFIPHACRAVPYYTAGPGLFLAAWRFFLLIFFLSKKISYFWSFAICQIFLIISGWWKNRSNLIVFFLLNKADGHRRIVLQDLPIMFSFFLKTSLRKNYKRRELVGNPFRSARGTYIYRRGCWKSIYNMNSIYCDTSALSRPLERRGHPGSPHVCTTLRCE